MHTNIRGILFILASGVFLTINDSLYKSLVPHYPAGQILFISGASVSILIWIIFQISDGSGIRVKSWPSHILRGLMFVVASFAFIISLKYLTLAETICIAFSGPLFMTVMAKYIIKEHVGLYRLLAVSIGFVGVIIIIRPSTSEFRWILLLPLVVALAEASRDILTRKMAPGESSLSIVFTTSLVLSLASLLTFAAGWNTIQSSHFLRLGISAFLTIASYFCMVEAYRHAPTVVIAPFRYIQIIWGILLGVIIWGEIPGAHIYLGVVIIVGAGIFIGLREAKKATGQD